MRTIIIFIIEYYEREHICFKCLFSNKRLYIYKNLKFRILQKLDKGIL